MKRNILKMVGCAVCMATVFAATQASAVVDKAASVGKLADLGAVVTQAHKALATATEGGDAIAVADAKKRADAAEAAMAAGKDAYEQLVAALGSGDEAAAAVAADALNAALEAAINALAGVFPQEEQGGAPAGQGKADGVVNIFKKLWDSKGKQVVEEGEFNIQLDTTPSLEGEDGPDGGGGEATPV